jgi:hypothetical protein
MLGTMRILLATLLLAAACGSKSPAPTTTPAEETPAEPTGATDENGNPVEIPEDGFAPAECDQYCADGCPEVEDYDGCMEDCGCAEGGDGDGE